MLSYLPSSRLDPYKKEISGGFIAFAGTSGIAIETLLLNYTWSPIIWRHGNRVKKDFFESHYCVLDFDDPFSKDGKPVSIEIIQRKYENSWHIIGTTRSHQIQKGNEPPCDRFRLLLKWDRAITSCDEYEHNIKLIVDDLGADDSCIDGARMIYKCSKIISTNYADDAELEPVKESPSAELKAEINAKYLKSCARDKRCGLLPWFARKFFSEVMPGNSVHCPRFRLACELARAGMDYDEAMRRLLLSPTYAGKDISPRMMTELHRVMAAGYKTVAESEPRNTKTP